MRQIILDTETTGISIEQNHRLIEIGCLEMVNRKLTGERFHCYLNPEREIEKGAQAVHGITDAFLQDKPKFIDVAKDFINFVADSELIIHNAPFDVGFINHELSLLAQGYRPLIDYCRIIDTLVLARQIHIGQRNSLDALCKRYGVDNSKREYHGALLDAYLLAQVYLAMTGGQGSFMDVIMEQENQNKQKNKIVTESILAQDLHVFYATEQELEEHQRYLALLNKQGKCLWSTDD